MFPIFALRILGEFQALFQKFMHPWLQTPRGYAEVIRDVVDSWLTDKTSELPAKQGV
jgi:hypothetical protein